MGRDKYENEDLIKYGLPCDVWFHVDNLSSAHVYLRLPEGMEWTEIPEEALVDCAQLVKQNSIQGCKQNHVDVVYTPWGNLKKTKGMDVGQVGFHDQKQVKKLFVERKDNDILNRLNKTRTEPTVDFAKERERYDKSVSAQRKAQLRSDEAQRAQDARAHREAMEIKQYKGVMDDDLLGETRAKMDQYDNAEDFEDDFM